MRTSTGLWPGLSVLADLDLMLATVAICRLDAVGLNGLVIIVVLGQGTHFHVCREIPQLISHCQRLQGLVHCGACHRTTQAERWCLFALA